MQVIKAECWKKGESGFFMGKHERIGIIHKIRNSGLKFKCERQSLLESIILVMGNSWCKNRVMQKNVSGKKMGLTLE